MIGKYAIFGLCLTILSACCQRGHRVDLGNLQTGATVSFIRAEGGDGESNLQRFRFVSDAA